EHYVFLLKEVTCHWDSTTHGNLVRGTAYTGNSNSFCTHFFCICNHFRTVSHFADHFGKTWVMSMNNDIHVFFYHNTQVRFCLNRLWCTEEYVRKLCSHHGTAPSIRKSCTDRLFYQGFWFRRTSHVSHM